MLTVCIPIYNYDARELINNLHEQSLQLAVPVEILAINDGSAEEYKELYRNFSFESFRYIELSQNIGRAKIRNLLAKEAMFDNLLFLDCDVKIVSAYFLKKYQEIIQKFYDVAYGGRVYPKHFPGKNKSLHWKYVKAKRSELDQIRKRNPYRSFMTHNFLIRKEVFDSIRLDENLNSYGHEDTLFGMMLELKKKKLIHINNPVLNIDFDDNENFLRKTQQGVLSSIQILNFVEEKSDFIRHVTLLQFYFKMKRRGFLPLLKASDKIFLKLSYKLLANGNGGITLLNFYKLLFLVRHFSSKK